MATEESIFDSSLFLREIEEMVFQYSGQYKDLENYMRVHLGKPKSFQDLLQKHGWNGNGKNQNFSLNQDNFSQFASQIERLSVDAVFQIELSQNKEKVINDVSNQADIFSQVQQLLDKQFLIDVSEYKGVVVKDKAQEQLLLILHFILKQQTLNIQLNAQDLYQFFQSCGEQAKHNQEGINKFISQMFQSSKKIQDVLYQNIQNGNLQNWEIEYEKKYSQIQIIQVLKDFYSKKQFTLKVKFFKINNIEQELQAEIKKNSFNLQQAEEHFNKLRIDFLEGSKKNLIKSISNGKIDMNIYRKASDIDKQKFLIGYLNQCLWIDQKMQDTELLRHYVSKLLGISDVQQTQTNQSSISYFNEGLYEKFNLRIYHLMDRYKNLFPIIQNNLSFNERSKNAYSIENFTGFQNTGKPQIMFGPPQKVLLYLNNQVFYISWDIPQVDQDMSQVMRRLQLQVNQHIFFEIKSEIFEQFNQVLLLVNSVQPDLAQDSENIKQEFQQNLILNVIFNQQSILHQQEQGQQQFIIIKKTQYTQEDMKSRTPR